MNATIAIETITPERAREWLDNRFEGQRKVRDAHVQKLAADILNGDWLLTCDAVTLIKGKLGNGQHRCEAIALANKAAPALVLRTTDEKLFDVIDSGVTRKVSDVLQQYNFTHTPTLAAAGRLALQYQKGMVTRAGITPKLKKNQETLSEGVVTRSEVVEFCEAHREEMMDYVRLLEGLSSGKNYLPQSMACALLLLVPQGWTATAKQFIVSVYQGGKDDAAHVLRERLIRNKLSSTKLPNAYIFGILIKAFKAYREGLVPEVLKIGPQEQFPRL